MSEALALGWVRLDCPFENDRIIMNDSTELSSEKAIIFGLSRAETSDNVHEKP
jgi:hypothetical protein